MAELITGPDHIKKPEGEKGETKRIVGRSRGSKNKKKVVDNKKKKHTPIDTNDAENLNVEHAENDIDETVNKGKID